MATPDPVLEKHLQRQLIRYAVQRVMFCPISGVVLDMRTVVIVENAAGDTLGVISPQSWESIKEGVLAKLPDAVVRTWDNPLGKKEQA